jgi:hypothetical protein
VATAESWTITKRLSQSRWDQVLGCVWLCALGISLLLSAQTAYRKSMQVEEYPLGCDPFGYLRMAKDIRQAASQLELPRFSLESPQTRLLIDFMRSRNVPLPFWDEIVAPHAYHYFPQAGHVGVQYPPGTGMALALFPEGEAVRGLKRAVMWLFLATGLLLLMFAAARQSWVAAGFVMVAVNLGLEILGRIDTNSYSIDAMLMPLFLACMCVCAALWLRSATKGLWQAGLVAFVSGSLLGVAILIRLPVIFLVPGFLLLLWPRSWYSRLHEIVIPFCLGVILLGVLPVLLHQERLAGAWYIPTYGLGDTASPTLAALGKNLVYYLGGGEGSQDNGTLVLLLSGIGGLVAFRSPCHAGDHNLAGIVCCCRH